MGVIKRQALKRTGLTYVGVLIGTISNLLIYPLAWEAYGLAQFLINTTALLLPIASFGLPSVAVKYFPKYDSTNGRDNSFLFLLLACTLITFMFFALILFFFGPYLILLLKHLNMSVDPFEDNKIIIFVIVGFLAFNGLLTSYISNYKRIVIPVFFSNVLHKIILPILILSLIYNYVDIQGFKLGFIGMYFITSLGLVWYLGRLRKFFFNSHFAKYTPSKMKKMGEFAFYSFFTVIGSVLAFKIDGVMITSYLGYKLNGYYSFFLFMTNVMIIPYNSIIAIANPIIAQAWVRGDLEEIKTVYTRSSENLFIAASFILLGAWLCLDDLLNLTINLQELLPFKHVFLILGIGQLVNMLSGPSKLIIAHSRFFRFNLIAVLVLAILTIYLNVLLIPRLGLVGAAYATAIALLAFNILKVAFILWKFGMSPFTKIHLHVLFIAVVAYGVGYLVPMEMGHLLNILVKGLVFVVTYVFLLYWSKVSEDFNELIVGITSRYK